MRYVVKGATENACWQWTGAKKETGYGRVRINWEEYRASRLSWAIHNSRDPGDMDVLHSCDNPECANPRHLFLGTHTDNMRDHMSKGGSLGGRGISRNVGIKNGQAKLTDADIIAIRAACQAGEMQKTVAARFGVCQATISMIVNGKLRRAAEALEYDDLAEVKRKQG